MRIHDRKQVQAPVSLVGTLVDKTWWTFGWIVIGFYLFALIWNYLILRLFDNPATAAQAMVTITPVIILLMGMAVAITGHNFALLVSWLCGRTQTAPAADGSSRRGASPGSPGGSRRRGRNYVWVPPPQPTGRCSRAAPRCTPRG